MAYSYPAIVEIFKYCPVGLTVTSTKRNGNFDHHDFGNAVDFAALYSQFSVAAAAVLMRDAAAWWMQFRGYLLEEIHTTPFNDPGYYVKNGQRVGEGFYGWDTEAAHRDHVHIAMSYGSAQTVLSGLKRRYGPPGRKTSGVGVVKAPAPKPPVPVPSVPGGSYYVVQPGDTLSGIAKTFGTTVDAIMKLNPYRRGPYWDGIPNPNKIEPGWRVRYK